MLELVKTAEINQAVSCNSAIAIFSTLPLMIHVYYSSGCLYFCNFYVYFFKSCTSFEGFYPLFALFNTTVFAGHLNYPVNLKYRGYKLTLSCGQILKRNNVGSSNIIMPLSC